MSKRRPESGIVVIWVFLALALSACTRQGQPTQAEPVRMGRLRKRDWVVNLMITIAVRNFGGVR